jgi:two-component system phosphate regulon sensor histidine kinase PhoR
VKLGVRGKLFGVSVALIVGVGLISGIYLEFSLRTWLEARAVTDLWRQARTARDMIEMSPGPLNPEALAALAVRLGDSTGTRVTLITPQGGVFADSKMGDARLLRTENHLQRQEVQAALTVGEGIARRFSDTLRTPMLYAALPFRHQEVAGVAGVARLAQSLRQVDVAINKLRLILVATASVGLAAALCVGGLASHYASRALRNLVTHAQKVARGEKGRRVAVWPEDEIGGLAGSFNQIADNLERVVSVLGHERDQVAAILESMSEAVLAIDAKMRITLINGAAIELLGTSGQPLGTLFAQTVENAALRDLVERASEGLALRSEFHVNARRVLGRATPLSESGGSVIVLHDITEVRRLETVRRDFVANVSHELRTPVSIIRANAETLLEGALSDPQVARPFAEALLRNAERLGRILADLLDISRVEAGHLKLRQQPIALVAAARRAAEALQPAARRKGLHVQVVVPEALTVLGDLQALDQVLLNLLDNAIKYTPEGGHVVVGAQSHGPEVRLEVSDDGPGLQPQHRQRVFERFYRVDPGRSRAMGGTGLGLSIVKHLCETMGGRVGIEAVQPHGARFWFALPQVAEAPAESVAGPALRSASA